MPPTQPTFLVPEAQAYIESVVAGESTVMRRVREACEAEGLPAVSPVTGALLRTLAAATRARRVVEVGCLYGYSALWLASAGPDVRVDTIEMDDETADVAEANFGDAGVADRVTVHRGRALDVLPRLTGPAELVFLDAAKAELVDYLAHAKRLLGAGGVIAADNVLWSGRVWDAADRSADTDGIRAYTAAVHADPTLASSLLPVGDGLLVSAML